jgi:hypothetical protein
MAQQHLCGGKVLLGFLNPPQRRAAVWRDALKATGKQQRINRQSHE